MPDSTRDSDRIMQDARAVLRDNQNGGRHRRAVGPAIGRESKRLRNKHVAKKLRNIAIAAAAIFAFAFAAGIIIDGIGFVGVMLTFFALLAAGGIFATFPRMKPPQRADLARTQDAKQLVGRTELWLEHQRSALPAPAARIVEGLGTQLDALGKQLAHVDPAHPAAGEVRKLVGEILPETIDSYLRIPDSLRGEERAGSTPDQQLVSSLKKISKEVDSVTRQLAQGSLDDLAIKDRYLDYRYGDAEGLPVAESQDAGIPLNEGSGVPLPDFDRERSRS